MSWSIGVKTNTLKMSMDVADKLVEAASENGHSISYSESRGLDFDPDAMEWMDFLSMDWSREILDHPSVNGDVVFMSAEGDDAGDIWGYRYIQGKITRLIPVVTYEEVPFE